MNIKDLNIGIKYATLKLKIVKDLGSETFIGRYGKPRSVHRFLVADETGTIELKIWDRPNIAFNKGDIIIVEKAFVTSYRGKLILNVGKLGRIRKAVEP